MLSICAKGWILTQLESCQMADLLRSLCMWFRAEARPLLRVLLLSIFLDLK